MTTILTLAFIVLAAYCWFGLRRVNKHDRVLFPLCQLRRDVLSFLYTNTFTRQSTLSPAEYDSLIKLSNMLDSAIHNYNEHKTVMFNLRKLMSHLKKYRHTMKQTKLPELPDNPEIQAFHARFVQCLAQAFIAYTPLIRSEIVLQVTILACRVVYYVGYRTVSKHASQSVSKHASQYVLASAKEARELARA